MGQSASQEIPQPSTENVTLRLEGVVFDEATLVNSPIVPYACMVASLIEGRTICREDLIAALRKSMRQRSIAYRSRREYVLHYLNRHPP